MFLTTLSILNAAIVLLGILVVISNSTGKRFSVVVIQVLCITPLLAVEYMYLSYNFYSPALKVVLLSEVIFSLCLLLMTLHLHRAIFSTSEISRMHILGEIIFQAVIIFAAFFITYYSPIQYAFTQFSFTHFSPIYFQILGVLFVILFSSWRLEQFWRSLEGARRWEYKFFIIGNSLLFAVLVWSSSYRLTYLGIHKKHMVLLGMLLLSAWIMMLYSVGRHRLLNRKIFVSRKIIYSFVAPTIFTAYLLIFGFVTLIMRVYGLEMSFVIKWLVLVLGLVGIGVFIFSGRFRRRVHFFISTHFYINKYEYRDEWLALSQNLQGVLTEDEVVNALRNVMSECLYTSRISIWLGDPETSLPYLLKGNIGENQDHDVQPLIEQHSGLASYLKKNAFFHLQETAPTGEWLELYNDIQNGSGFGDLVLFSSISVGNQLLGIIGLGPEFTGGKYGHDDFDLLTALGSQTGAAILAVNRAEKIANMREQQAWNRLSSFVLHDIKNAATMLSLLRENAADHIHDPEFQHDMLASVDDALVRMDRVEKRLNTLKETIEPNMQQIDLAEFLNTISEKFARKLHDMKITVAGDKPVPIVTDKDFVSTIFENLFLNTYEARGDSPEVHCEVQENNRNIEVIYTDNGAGIADVLLPDLLFEPFKTTRSGGSGIGLWQVKKLMEGLGGTVAACNTPEGNAQFVLQFPL